MSLFISQWWRKTKPAIEYSSIASNDGWNCCSYFYAHKRCRVSALESINSVAAPLTLFRRNVRRLAVTIIFTACRPIGFHRLHYRQACRQFLPAQMKASSATTSQLRSPFQVLHEILGANRHFMSVVIICNERRHYFEFAKKYARLACAF